MEKQMLESMERVEEKHWWFRARREILLDRLSVLGRGNPRILDIGCGTGANLAAMTRLLPEATIIGLDLDATCREACERKGFTVQAGDITDLEFPDNHFDAVTAFDILEHIGDEAGALKELARTMTQGGTLFVTVPAYKWLWSQHDERAHHHRRYTKGSLTDALAQAGFVPRYATYFNTLLFPVAVAVRMAERLTGRVTDGQALLPGPIEESFYRIFRMEKAATSRGWRIPFGLSILVVAENTRA